MPLKVMDVVDQRVRIVLEAEEPGVNARALCARHGIGRSTLYEWRAAYRRGGLAGLVPRSRAPRSSPWQLPVEVEDRVLALRKEHGWGPRKIRDQLRREGLPVPAISTVQQALARRGVLTPRRERRGPRNEGRRFAREHSNQLWQIDGTQHRLANGREFWVVDIVDDCSRFCVTALVGPSLTGALAWRAVREAVGRFGLPAELLSDNGACFTGRTQSRIVSFERQVHAAGVRFRHSRPYNPRCCGKVERIHQTQKDWLARRPAARSLSAAQTLLEQFRQHYNTDRPHQALDGRAPVEVYTPAEAVELPALDLAPADAFPDGATLRKVSTAGTFGYRRTRFKLSERFAGVTIGLLPDRNRLHVYYGSSLIETYITAGTNAAGLP